MKQAFVAGVALLGLAMAPAMQASSGDDHAQGHHHHGHHGQAGHAGPGHHEIAALPLAKSVKVSDCWIRLLPLPAPSAGYFVAHNQGDTPVTLTAAASERYGDVMLHQTTHTDGMSRMSHVEGVEIAGQSRLEFTPGGYHIMLEKPAGEIAVGDRVPMQFLFASNEKAEANCEVKPANTLAK